MDEVDFLILHKRQALAQEEKKNQALREKFESFAKPEEISVPHIDQLRSMASDSKEGQDENRNPNDGSTQPIENQESANKEKIQLKFPKKPSRNPNSKAGEKTRSQLKKRASSLNKKPSTKKKA